MQCPHPITIINKKDPYTYYDNGLKLQQTIQVPCGKCPVCLDNRRQDWFIRLNEEMKSSDLSLFVTLTYDNEQLFYNDNKVPSVYKPDVQKFFKRFRKNLDLAIEDFKIPKITLRYFLASEYGSSGQRPHYHTCLFFKFNWRDENEFNKIYDIIRLKLQRSWQKGFIDIGILSLGGMNYVTKYIHKKRYPPDKADKTFQLQSQGLGLDYICCSTYDYHKGSILSNYKYKLNNRNYRLPRYYKEKIYEEDEKEFLRREFIKKEIEELKQMPSPIDDPILWQEWCRKRKAQIEGEEYKRRKRLKMSSGIIDT